MIIMNRNGSIRYIICMAIVFLLFFSAIALAAKKTVERDATWEVRETTRLKKLVIAEGAVITAPDGRSLTLTVDGVETPIEPGTYKGDVVLTVTDDFVIEFKEKAYKIRAAVAVEDGRYVPEKSVAAAVTRGEVTDSVAKDVRITSVGDNFNGIIARGEAPFSYSISDPEIMLTGNGANDFVGYGAAIVSDGKANVTVDNATILTTGVIRSAVVVRGDSTMHVNNSEIEVRNGIMPAGITEPWAGGNGKTMMAVPWMLGLVGNCRATNMIANGTAYYNNTHIKAQGWGALSTDATTKVRLYATESLIETIESGYGAYSIGDCLDSFSHCTFNVKDMALIMAGNGSGAFTDGTVVNSDRFGVMMHSGSGGTLTIDDGTVFNTKSTSIQVKGSGSTILVDNAELNSGNGILLQSMANDDPNMAGGRGGSLPAGMLPPGGETTETTPAGGGREGMPSNGPGGDAGSGDIIASFKNVTLDGDIVNGNTAASDLIVTFENATITGAITTAVTTAVGTPSYEKYYLIGDAENRYCATEDENALQVVLESGTTWIVDRTSYLDRLSIADDASVLAPLGYGLAMTVDGKRTTIHPGTYAGKIVLSVSE